MSELSVLASGPRRLLRPLPALLFVGSLGVAALLTAARIAQPGGSAGVALTSVALFGLPAALVAFLLLPVVSLRHQGIGLPAIGGAVALLLVAVQVGQHGSLLFGGTQHAVSSKDDLTVMTLNVRAGHADAAEIVRLVQERHVQVLTLLELTPQLRTELEQDGLSQLLPYAEDNVWHEDEGRATYTKEPFVEERRMLGGGLLGHVLTIGSGPTRLTYVAVHISRPLRHDAFGWELAYRQLHDLVASISGPVVIAGDFGATLDNQPLLSLLSSGFRDSVVETGGFWRPTYPATGYHRVLGIPVPALLAIDHVLGRDVEFHGSSTAVVAGSDHEAVLASFALLPGS